MKRRGYSTGRAFQCTPFLNILSCNAGTQSQQTSTKFPNMNDLLTSTGHAMPCTNTQSVPHTVKPQKEKHLFINISQF